MSHSLVVRFSNATDCHVCLGFKQWTGDDSKALMKVSTLVLST